MAKRYDIMRDRQDNTFCIYQDGKHIHVGHQWWWDSLEGAHRALDELEEDQKPRLESVFSRSF